MIMPIRTTPLVNGEIYHIVNRGVNHQPIFNNKWDYNRALELIWFYEFTKPPMRFSYYDRLPADEKNQVLRSLEISPKSVSLIAYCLMPNHFHFLLRQGGDHGISRFLANFQNSYTRYFNTKHSRSGHLFQGQFKAIRIDSDNQLLHTSRYIHLNPYTSYVVKTIDELKDYEWSSLKQYLEKKTDGLCETETVLGNFSSGAKYLEFVNDQKDYQRTLDQIKHMLLE